MSNKWSLRDETLLAFRKYSEIAPEEMFLGSSADRLERTVGLLDKLNEEANPTCRERSPVQ
jgi:hypothetical protein